MLKILSQKPHVFLSFAQSTDGFIARSDGTSRFSSHQDMAKVHELRANCDAILVGRRTVEVDDSRLTARTNGILAEKQPLRVVLDSKASLDISKRVFNEDAKTLIAVGKRADPTKLASLRSKADVFESDSDAIDLPALLLHLKRIGINSVLVEGGGEVINSFLSQNLVDSMRVSFAPEICKSGIMGASLSKLAMNRAATIKSVEQFGNNIVLTYDFYSS